jgi:parallel beta-helix repeat protein
VWAAQVEPLETRVLMSTYIVTTAADAGAGSLRTAITSANAHAGADRITFAIGSGAKTISLTSGLPAISDALTLDATTQPGYAGKPLIELNGANAGASAYGIKITGGNSTIKGLIISRFGQSGIFLYSAGGNRILGNYIGTNASGDAAAGNLAHGILVQSRGNIIGGAGASDRNLISGNGDTGVFLYSGAAAANRVEGNYIGTNAAGTAAVGNAKQGVAMDGAGSNFIGTYGRNVISGNGRDGVLIIHSGATLDVVQNNFIGTNAAGAARLGNGWYGIEISQPNNVIGGRWAGNVVSANGKGGIVMFLATATGNRVQANFVGTDFTGARDLGNTGRGVEFTNGASNNRLGGARWNERNVISGNDAGGVGIYSHSHNNLLQRNLIGTNAAGTAALGNTGAGVTVTDSAGTNFIGTVKAGNIISGNGQGVVLTSGTAPSIVYANYIGTDVTGRRKIANATDGIYLSSSQNQIGGRRKGTGNVISGNGGDGIRMNNSSGNLITRNIIGADATAAGALANGNDGILMIGVTDTPVRGNIIAHNTADGVQVATGSRNSVVSNSIYSNGRLGINLGWDSATRNDTSDADAGANALQNFPTLLSAKNSVSQTLISGSINAAPNTSLYVELFSGAAGQGDVYLGALTVRTNSAGQASFSAPVPRLAVGAVVTATATGPAGTSEFAPGVAVR